MKSMPPAQSVLDAFGATLTAVPLPGGEGRTFRSGEIVLRRENPGGEDDATFNAELFTSLGERVGFRLPRPRRTASGAWLTPDGWSACEFVDGRPGTREDAPAMIAAIKAFHVAIAGVPRPSHLARRTNPYQRADVAAFGEPVQVRDRNLATILDELYARRTPLSLPEQLIHGDANEQNILIAPGMPPAIIDLAAYWRPAAFAVAVNAFWLGPFRGDAEVLRHYEHSPEFAQLLLRALIRSLVVMDGFGYGRELPSYRRAIEIVVRRL